MVSIVGARCFAPDIGHAQRAPTMQGAQELRSEAHFQVRCNDEVEAHRRRWTFFETIKIGLGQDDRKEGLLIAPYLISIHKLPLPLGRGSG